MCVRNVFVGVVAVASGCFITGSAYGVDKETRGAAALRADQPAAVEPSDSAKTTVKLVPQRIAPGGRRPNWYLGVSVANTSNGCRVESVVRNSPAWFVGLEVGDYIAAVDSFPVGYLDQTLYTLASEFRRSDGKVDLLVLDRRTRQYVDLAVSLDQR